MIGWLSGKIVSRDAAGAMVVLDVAGVGYQLAVSMQTFTALPDDGKKLQLFVHTHVREEALALFGFTTPLERQVFKMLISVPKVGPKNAISVLGGFPLDEVIDSIARGETGKLTRIPGIGKKTAEQLVLSLRDKMELLSTTEGEPSPPEIDGADELREEAAAALIQWGWKAKPVGAALDRVLEEAGDDALTLEELLMRTTRILTER